MYSTWGYGCHCVYSLLLCTLHEVTGATALNNFSRIINRQASERRTIGDPGSTEVNTGSLRTHLNTQGYTHHQRVTLSQISSVGTTGAVDEIRMDPQPPGGPRGRRPEPCSLSGWVILRFIHRSGCVYCYVLWHVKSTWTLFEPKRKKKTQPKQQQAKGQCDHCCYYI